MLMKYLHVFCPIPVMDSRMDSSLFQNQLENEIPLLMLTVELIFVLYVVNGERIPFWIAGMQDVFTC